MESRGCATPTYFSSSPPGFWILGFDASAYFLLVEAVGPEVILLVSVWRSVWVSQVYSVNQRDREHIKGYLRAIPFDILRGGRLETKNKNVWGGIRRKIKCVWQCCSPLRWEKIKCMGGVREKIKMCGGRPGFFPVRPTWGFQME